MADPSEDTEWGKLARTLVPPAVSGRIQVVPSVLPTTQHGQIVCQGRWPTAQPRTLLIGQVPDWSRADGNPGWPPADSSQQIGGPASFLAGMVDSDNGQLWLTNPNFNLQIACVLEWGAGSSGHFAIFDWNQGCYALSSCDYARVSALAWGAAWTPTDRWYANAALVPGHLDGAMVPTLSGVRNLTNLPGGSAQLMVPTHARAFEVYPVNQIAGGVALPTGRIRVQGSAVGIRDYAANVITPGWTPLEITTPSFAGATVNITVDQATPFAVMARFFLQI